MKRIRSIYYVCLMLLVDRISYYQPLGPLALFISSILEYGLRMTNNTAVMALFGRQSGNFDWLLLACYLFFVVLER